MNLATMYHDNLPLQENLDMDIISIMDGDLPDRPKDTLVYCDKLYFPNTHTLLTDLLRSHNSSQNWNITI